jgi:hypothetical protein
VIHTYVFDLFQCTPRLAVTAPTRGCAKTLLPDVLRPLVQRAFEVMDPSSASIFRTVDAAKPTILLDEADTFLHENKELQGIFNRARSCHRGGHAGRGRDD